MSFFQGCKCLHWLVLAVLRLVRATKDKDQVNIYILGVLGAGLLTWQQPVRGAWVCRGLRLYGYLWQQLLLAMPLFQIHLEKGWGGPKASPRAKENERGKAGADELDLLLLH